MKVAILVASCYPLQAIVGHKLDLVLVVRSHILGDNLVQILLHELEDKVEAVFLANDLF